jgi:hypothetical protein
MPAIRLVATGSLAFSATADTNINSASSPTITSFSPGSGPAGTPLAIVGTNFVVGATVVRIGGVIQDVVTVVSPSLITLNVDADSLTGVIRVETIGGVGLSDDPFTITPALTGDYAYLYDTSAGALLPIDVGTGSRMLPNTTTGLYDGTTIDTTEPTWAFTVPLTDTGVPTTNFTNLQNAINTAASSMTGNTNITMPASFVWRGKITFRRNVTGFIVGLTQAVRTGMPVHVPTTNGATRPKKVNRIVPGTHLALMPKGERAVNTEALIDVELCDVKGYYVRGIQITNPLNHSAFTQVYLRPYTTFLPGFSSIVSTTANTATLNAGATATSLSNFTLWIHRGPGSTQIFHNVNYNGTTKVITLNGSDVWTTPPVTADRLEFLTQSLPAGAPAVTDPQRFFPEDISFVQCYQNGGTGQNVTRAYYLSGRRIAVVDGYTESLGALGQDSQDVFVYGGQGPFKYTNCESYIGGAKENFISGGSSLVGQGDEFLPENLEIRYNKTRSAGFGTPKASIEIKYGRYGIIEANDVGDQDAGSFNGEITIKLTDQFGDNLFVDTQHWTVRIIRVKNAGGLLQLSSGEGYSGTNITRNIAVIGNVQVNTPSGNKGIAVGGRMQNVTIDHNTICGSAANGEFSRLLFFPDANTGGYVNGPNMRMRRNVVAGPFVGPWSIQGGAPFYGNALESVLGVAAEISQNLCTTSDATNYSDQIRAGGDYDSANIGFVNRAGGDVRLSATSLGYQAAPGGKDIGADVVLVNALLADVV